MTVGQADHQHEDAEGKYRILVGLGEGGTANVFLAVARGPAGFSKLVVLKALKPHLSAEPELCAMFMNEARLAARLNHPNVVQTYEVVEEDGVPLMVMEYLEGQPLSNILVRSRNGGLPLAANLQIIVDALEGLHYAHELADFDGTPLGVVHRDMTPHNVFVTYDGQVKILDFGIAKLATSMVETQTGVIKGKIRYMPPEQLTGEAIDRRADIFAVGVMLWEAAAGARLWKDMPDAAIMNSVINGDIPLPSSINPDIPRSLEKICMKALAADRNQRHATALELQGEIEQVLAELGERITNKQIGQGVSALFAEERRKTKTLTESRLSKVKSLTWAEYRASEAPILATTVTQSRSRDGHADSYTRSGQEIDETISLADKGGRRSWLFATGIGIAIIAGFVFWKRPVPPPARASTSLTSTASPAPAVSAASAPAEPAPQKPKNDRVEVRLSARPSEAKLFFDDTPLEGNPFVKTMLADGAQHVVRAEAPGYAPSTAILVLEKDTDVALTLERIQAPVSRRGRAPSPSAATATAKPAPTAPEKNCDPPYTIDANGIKRVKLECM